MNIVKIDLSAIAYNLKQIRAFLPRKVKIMGIVKSDAYGHGLIQVAGLLSKEGIDLLGVAYPFEAHKLTKNGIKRPIVILCGFQDREEARMIISHDMIPVVWGMDMASLLNREAEGMRRPVSVLIKVDTGMGRLGVPCEEIGPFIRAISDMKMLRIKGLLSHLSSAHRPDDTFTKTQIQKFQKAVKICHNMGLELSMNSLANSAGMINYREETMFDIVRPGIILYGGLPSPGFVVPFRLKQAMQFMGRILQIRIVPPNTPISYGRTYHTKTRERIAIISCGYGNGIPKAISNKGYVIIRDKRAPIVGQICMDLLVCNVTHIENAIAGDDVIFIGSSEREKISPDDVAKWAGTISYEVLCSIGKINKREYSHETEDRGTPEKCY